MARIELSLAATLALMGVLQDAADGIVGFGDSTGGVFHSLGKDVTAMGRVVIDEVFPALGLETVRWTQIDGLIGLGLLALLGVAIRRGRHLVRGGKVHHPRVRSREGLAVRRIAFLLAVLAAPTLSSASASSVTFDFDSGPGVNFTTINDGGLWTIDADGPDLRISKPSDNLAFNPTAAIFGGSESAFRLHGDFEITVDFTLDDFPAAGSGKLNESRFGTRFDNDINSFEILRFRQGSLNRIEVFSVPGSASGATTSTLTQGRYRIARVGSVFTGSYATTGSSSFTQVATVGGFSTEPVRIQLRAFQGKNPGTSFRSSTSMDISFDDLIIEADEVSGLVQVWRAPVPLGFWNVAGSWDPNAIPEAGWDVIATNESHPFDQAAVVSADSTVDSITISGAPNTMSVHVEEGVHLTSNTVTDVLAQGIVRVDGTFTTETLNINTGGTVRVEVTAPGINHINVNGDATIAAGATLTIDEGTTPVSGAHLFPILQADADSDFGGALYGTFDTVNLLPGDDALDRRYSLLYENRGPDGVGVVDTVKVGLARPGDADFDGTVDAIDLLAASSEFGTGNIVGWRDGNWRDTGSSAGVVDSLDLLDASPFFNQSYGGGELALDGDETRPGQSADGNPSIIYDFTSGEVLIDTDGNTTNTYVLDSLAGIFTGAAPNFIGGTIFQTDNDFRIAENFHSNLSGLHNLGSVAQAFLNQAFLLADLTLQGGSAGNPNFEFDLVIKNTPEPSTIVLIGLGVVGLVGVARQRRPVA